MPRETGFDITAASEVMAILCLADSPGDLRARLDRILVGYTDQGEPVLAGEIGVTGSMAAILNEAILPNLVQSTRGDSRVRPRRPVRQHRARLQLGPGDADGAGDRPTTP